MSARPIGYTDSGEPVWPVSQDVQGGCDHPHGWICDEIGEHTNRPWQEVNELLRNVYAALEATDDAIDYGSVPYRRARADILIALSMADDEATDPCIDCDHPVRCHDEAFPSPCMGTGCKCDAYIPGPDSGEGRCPDGCCP